MQLLHLFPTPVTKTNLGREFTAEELSFIKNQSVRKNEGNTSSENSYVFNSEVFLDLKIFVQSCIDKFFTEVYAPKNDVKLRITQSWLNYTKEGQYHHKHTHPNSFISGVLYITADTAKDKIYFFQSGYEHIHLPTKKFNVFNSPSWWVPVGTGDLVLFNSSLPHGVQKVEGEERISLAFNTFLVGHIGEEKDLTALHV